MRVHACARVRAGAEMVTECHGKVTECHGQAGWYFYSIFLKGRFARPRARTLVRTAHTAHATRKETLYTHLTSSTRTVATLACARESQQGRGGTHPTAHSLDTRKIVSVEAICRASRNPQSREISPALDGKAKTACIAQTRFRLPHLSNMHALAVEEATHVSAGGHLVEIFGSQLDRPLRFLLQFEDKIAERRSSNLFKRGMASCKLSADDKMVVAQFE